MSNPTEEAKAKAAVKESVEGIGVDAPQLTDAEHVDTVNHADDTNPAENRVVSIFAQKAKKQLSEGSKEDAIIKMLLDSGMCEKRTVNVQDVLPDDPDKRKAEFPSFTLSFKQEVYGMVDLGARDAANRPVKELGPTRGIMFSIIDLRTAAKRDAKAAFVISGITALKDEKEQLRLLQRAYIGSKLTLIQQFVPAHTEFKNPFASNPKTQTWTEDKVITYIVGYTPGETLVDSYNKSI